MSGLTSMPTVSSCTFTEEELAAFVTKIVQQTIAQIQSQSQQKDIVTSSSIPAQIPSNTPVRDARKVEPIPAEVALNRAMRLSACSRPTTDKETQWSLEGIESMIAQCHSRAKLAESLKYSADTTTNANHAEARKFRAMRAILLKRQWERISIKEYEEAELAELMQSSDDHENENDVQTRIMQGIQKIKDAQSKPSDQMPADIKRFVDRAALESSINATLFDDSLWDDAKDNQKILWDVTSKIMGLVDAFTRRNSDRAKLPECITAIITACVSHKVNAIPDILKAIEDYKHSV